jgi:hypothetical protein
MGKIVHSSPAMAEMRRRWISMIRARISSLFMPVDARRIRTIQWQLIGGRDWAYRPWRCDPRRRAVGHVKKEVRKMMIASSDRWVPPVISRTGIRTGLAGSWVTAQVSLSPLFFRFHVFSILYFQFCVSYLNFQLFCRILILRILLKYKRHIYDSIYWN